ncbi:MAG TPA: CPBP family intramembrane glutamic endopeptidase [Candidatus Dormibacteraeota bacterium]|nr:CPBP family intramembrane glutamic endopeptidase [Candidatus Dormibacteraeota bacterium]
MLLAVVVLANVGERDATVTIVAYACFVSTALFLGVASAYASLVGPGPGDGAPSLRAAIGAAIEGLAPVFAGLVLLPPARRLAARRLPQFRAESPVHAVALGFYVLILLVQAGGQVAIDQVKAIGQGGSPSVAFIIGTNQLPMVLVSIAGIGLFIRRTPRQALARLGLYWPGWRWIAAGAAGAVVLLFVGFGFDTLMALLTPEQNREIQQVTDQLFRSAASVQGFVIIGLAAGIGEEIFFRGAVQPRFGILLASLLFAALHTQYGISIATAQIFFIGVFLGLLRNRAGLLPAIVAHAGYDILAGVLPLLLPK